MSPAGAAGVEDDILCSFQRFVMAAMMLQANVVLLL